MTDFDIPKGWTRGELLDTIALTCAQGDYYILKPHFNGPEAVETLRMDGQDSANNFLGWWYAR